MRRALRDWGLRFGDLPSAPVAAVYLAGTVTAVLLGATPAGLALFAGFTASCCLRPSRRLATVGAAIAPGAAARLAADAGSLPPLAIGVPVALACLAVLALEDREERSRLAPRA